MEGGKGGSTVTIDENELRGHIVILSGKDFSGVEWKESPHVFMQRKA